ncbi:MAG: GntR family transcriptional regulator [Deltaproteobacteria bacterium]|nr:GntR family transcriptional regulator [Deltaproteobacteria bacterium]
MVEIGKINKLVIQRTLDYGAQLDGGALGHIILAKRDIPKRCRPGDEIEVFVYEDKDKHLLATTQKPYALVGQFAKLRVAANSSAGAYLDWGMQKDLLVPRSEQHTRMEKGKFYIVFVFLDKKTNRIAASTKLDKFFSTQPPAYADGEEVDLLIYDKTNLGYKAIVNDSHLGIVYKNEVFRPINIGQRLKGYIKKIRADLKIDLSLQQAGSQRVDQAAQGVLDIIKDLGGSITVSDQSPPADIYALFGISKKTFKRAVGALYKRELITVGADGIKLAGKEGG